MNEELAALKQKELLEEVAIYKQMVDDLKVQMEDGKGEVTRDEINRAMEVLYDPYDVQDPFKILAEIPPDETDPDGQVLQWKSPRYRERRGWRGWIPIHWDDQYGNEETLAKYVLEPPARMVGPDKVDSCVRRGDKVLSRLNKRIWQSRQLKRELLQAQQQGMYEQGQEQIIREGLRIVGKGLQRDDAKKPKTSEHYQEFDKDSALDGVHRTGLMEDLKDG